MNIIEVLFFSIVIVTVTLSLVVIVAIVHDKEDVAGKGIEALESTVNGITSATLLTANENDDDDKSDNEKTQKV